MQFRLLLYIVLYLLVSVHAIAKPVKSPIQTIPRTIIEQICRDLSEDKKGCQVGDVIHYIQSFKLDNDQLLLYFYLQNKQLKAPHKYPRGVTLPVKVNMQGEWLTGNAFVGEPQQIIRDNSGHLWMHAQFNSVGKSPRLLYSKEGLQWLDVDLPGDELSMSQFEEMKTVCWYKGNLYMKLQADGRDTLWKASLDKLLAAIKADGKVRWLSVPGNRINPATCKSYPEKNNHWLVQRGETLSLLRYNGAEKEIILKIPNRTVIKVPFSEKTAKAENKPTKKDAVQTTKETLSTTVSKKAKEGVDSSTESGTEKSTGNYAIQIGAFSNHVVIPKKVEILQKAGFRTFTRLLKVQGKAIKKVYIGPFTDRQGAEEALSRLQDTPEDSHHADAFVLKFR